MKHVVCLSALALLVAAAPLQAANITGKYVEARTCDVWTGPCFANAEFNLTGKNAVMAWQVDKGSLDNVALDGLGIVAVVRAANTLGLEQSSPSQVIFLVDRKATPTQRQALIRMAQQQGGKLLKNIIAVRETDINLDICECKGGVCADLQAGEARIKTRCLHSEHDKACGNESAYFPPLARGVRALPAAAEEHIFNGRGLGQTWSDFDRRGAYVGSFEVR